MSINYWFDAARQLLEALLSATQWAMFMGTFGIFVFICLILMMLTEERR